MTLGKHIAATGRVTYTIDGKRVSNHEYSGAWVKAWHAGTLNSSTVVRRKNSTAFYVCT